MTCRPPEELDPRCRPSMPRGAKVEWIYEPTYRPRWFPGFPERLAFATLTCGALALGSGGALRPCAAGLRQRGDGADPSDRLVTAQVFGRFAVLSAVSVRHVLRSARPLPRVGALTRGTHRDNGAPRKAGKKNHDKTTELEGPCVGIGRGTFLAATPALAQDRTFTVSWWGFNGDALQEIIIDPFPGDVQLRGRVRDRATTRPVLSRLQLRDGAGGGRDLT